MADNIGLTFTTANGTVIDLNDRENAIFERGGDGYVMPDFEMIEEEVPLEPGARLQFVKTKVREVEFPIFVFAQGREAFLALVESMASLMSPTRGAGKIILTKPGGVGRVLYCRYAGGLTNDGQTGKGGIYGGEFKLKFRAQDPFWYSEQEIQEVFTEETGSFFPFFPLRVSAENVFAGATIENAGSEEAWPIWEVEGPGQNLTLINLTTGRRFSMDYMLPPGRTLTIDTRPGQKSMYLDTGEQLFFDVVVDMDMWPLVSGTNEIRVELSNADNEVSSVLLRYTPRFTNG